MFKQTASHLPHEANSEQLFSRSGSLSDDNDKMDPARLAGWTSIGVNYSTYQPSTKQILAHYMLKFSKGGTAKLHEDDLGLLDEEGGNGDIFAQGVQLAPQVRGEHGGVHSVTRMETPQDSPHS